VTNALSLLGLFVSNKQKGFVNYGALEQDYRALLQSVTKQWVNAPTPLRGKVPLSGGYAMQCEGAIQGKEGGIQVLVGLAPSSRTVESLFRVIHELRFACS
jgi:hypothetical protein